MPGKEITPNNIAEKFLEAFPEFRSHTFYHNEVETYFDTPYLFFGVLNTIFVEYIEQNKEIDNVRTAIQWIDHTYNDADPEGDIVNLLGIEFFEAAMGSSPYEKFLLKNLTGIANRDLRRHRYIYDNGGLADANTGEIFKYVGMDKKSESTGKYITDIK